MPYEVSVDCRWGLSLHHPSRRTLTGFAIMKTLHLFKALLVMGSLDFLTVSAILKCWPSGSTASLSWRHNVFVWHDFRVSSSRAWIWQCKRKDPEKRETSMRWSCSYGWGGQVSAAGKDWKLRVCYGIEDGYHHSHLWNRGKGGLSVAQWRFSQQFHWKFP